jgi:hypothetical protein
MRYTRIRGKTGVNDILSLCTLVDVCTCVHIHVQEQQQTDRQIEFSVRLSESLVCRSLFRQTDNRLDKVHLSVCLSCVACCVVIIYS